MRHHKALRLSMAVLLGGGTLFSPGCGELIRRSLRDGTLAYIAGSATGYFDPTDLSNLFTNLLTGGFTGGWGGLNGGGWNSSPFDWSRS
jgi:hypothetical protein